MIGSFRTRAARRLGALLTAAGLVLAGGVVLQATAASAAAVGDQAICHADSNAKKPYSDKKQSVSVDSIINKNGHDSHNGPVFTPGMTKGWGDIIPPFSYTDKGNTKTYAGKNWTADGQAIWNNGCKLPVTPPVQCTSTPTFTYQWVGGVGGTFKVSLKAGSMAPCQDITWHVSSYTLNPLWDGSLDFPGNPAAPSYQQHKFDHTLLTFPKKTTQPVTATVSVPTCFGYQVDLYSGNEITEVGVAGHGSAFLAGGLVKLQSCDAPGLSVTKTLLTEGTVHPGDSIHYLVTVTNTGSTNLYNVVVTDAIPGSTSFDKTAPGSDARWNVDEDGLIATIGLLGATESTTLELTLKVEELSKQEWVCGHPYDLVNTASVKGFYPQPAETASPSPSPYTATATASPVTLEFPDCASITVDKLFWQEEGYQGGWTFTTELSDGTVNGHDAKDSQTTGTEGYAPASFDLKGYFGEDGKDVTITETPQDGWSLYDVACQALVLKGGWSSFEVDSDGNGASLKVHPGDHIKCVFINKRIPASTTPPSTQTTPPTVTTTPPTEVLGEKESPTPTTSVLGEKLPFTGAPTSTGLILSLVLVAGGALLLFGSTRRDAKHRG